MCGTKFCNSQAFNSFDVIIFKIINFNCILKIIICKTKKSDKNLIKFCFKIYTLTYIKPTKHVYAQ